MGGIYFGTLTKQETQVAKSRTFSWINRERCEARDGFNHQLHDWSLSDWMTALLGELGEAANIVKKVNRIRDGIPNTNGETYSSLKVALAEELADADIYLDLVYQRAGIHREMAILRKFNATSRKRNSPYLIASLEPMRVTMQSLPEHAEQLSKEQASVAAKDYVDGRFYAHEDPPKADSKQAIHPPPAEFTDDEVATDPVLRFFHYAHLPEKLRQRSAPFCSLASLIIRSYPRNAERTVALRKLLEAKDAAVRASIDA